MRKYLTVLITGLITGILLLSGAAEADQNSPLLPALFDKLNKETRPDRVFAIEGEIWHLWAQSDNPKAREPLARGIAALNDGEIRDAYGYFRDVTSAAPDFAEGWNKLATVDYLLGELEASVQEIQKTLTLEPRHFGALSGLSLIYEATGQPAQALDVLNQVKEIYPAMPGIDQRMQMLNDAIAAKKI